MNSEADEPPSHSNSTKGLFNSHEIARKIKNKLGLYFICLQYLMP